MTEIAPLTISGANSADQAVRLLTWACHDAGLPRHMDHQSGGSFKVECAGFDHGKPAPWRQANRLVATVAVTAPTWARVCELCDRVVAAVEAAGARSAAGPTAG